MKYVVIIEGDSGRYEYNLDYPLRIGDTLRISMISYVVEDLQVSAESNHVYIYCKEK